MCDLQPQRIGEVLDAGLGSVIGHHARGSGVRGRRRHDQDVAASLDHRRQRRAHRVEHPDDVHIDQGLERIRIDGEQGSDGRDSRIGHCDVDPAEPLHARGDGGLHGGQIAHVGDSRQQPIAAQPGRHAFEKVFVQVGEYQLGAFVVQASGHLRADAVGATGDEDDFSVD